MLVPDAKAQWPSQPSASHKHSPDVGEGLQNPNFSPWGTGPWRLQCSVMDQWCVEPTCKLMCSTGSSIKEGNGPIIDYSEGC